MTPWNPPSPHYRAIVYLVTGMLSALIIVALAFPSRIPTADGLWRSAALVLAGMVVVMGVTAQLPAGWRAILRAAGTIWLASFFFASISGVQHLIFDKWFDEEVIAFETMFTGIELSLWMQRITTPVLTEWMMLSYVIYIPLMPLTAWLTWRAGGEPTLYEFLFALLFSNILCTIGFVLLPIASPLWYDPTQYSVPLIGGPFTAMAEWIRATQHFPGGSLPSPHCANGAVLLLTLWRRNRTAAWVFLPFLLTILPATVYGRFHYISDGLAGIPVGILAYALSAALRRVEAGEVPHTGQARVGWLRIKTWRTS